MNQDADFLAYFMVIIYTDFEIRCFMRNEMDRRIMVKKNTVFDETWTDSV